MKKKKLCNKGILIGTIFLFIGASIIPAITVAHIQGNKDYDTGSKSELKNGIDTSEQQTWLVMVYLDGDNDKWQQALADLDELLTPRPTANRVHITVLCDLLDSAGHSGTILYHLHKAVLSEYNIPWGHNELNMGDSDTLLNFVDWSLDHFGAEVDRTMLVIWDHGSSWKECCRDETSGWDYLETDETKEALEIALKTRHNNYKLDILFFAACYMAGVEVCYELRDFADYYIASEYVQWLGGSRWGAFCDFDEVIKGLNRDNSLPVDEICRKLVDESIMQMCLDHSSSEKSHTWSVINLNLMDDLVDKLDIFAQDLIENFLDPSVRPGYCRDIIDARDDSPAWSNHRRPDLHDFADALCATSVTNALESAIVHETHREGTDDAVVNHAHGLHICFPKFKDDWASSKYLDGRIGDFVNDCHWYEWLTVFYGTLFVDDDFAHDNPPCWQKTFFDRIDDAIDAAHTGDTVWVFEGEYRHNVILSKSMTLTGLENPVIRFESSLKPAVLIRANGVTISGFTIENIGCGIKLLYVENCDISNNTIRSYGTIGIEIEHADDNTIKGNHIEKCFFGIYIDPIYPGSNNFIFNNYFDNTFNAHDEYGNNIWNRSKKRGQNIIGLPYLGGNYWHDYTGHDSVHLILRDGLGDTDIPYTCNGEIKNGGDMRPLVYTMVMDSVEIARPCPYRIYVGDYEFEPNLWVFEKPLIFGPVEIHVVILEPILGIISKVEIYIDEDIVIIDDKPKIPEVVWRWTEPTFGQHKIKVVAYDNFEVSLTKELDVLKFF